MKPIPVKILEWWFGVLAGLASLLPLPVVYGAFREAKGDFEFLLPAVGLSIGILFFWGLFLAVRRGQWASAELPYWSLILAAGAFLPAFHSGRHAALVNKGQEVSRLLRENELAKSPTGATLNLDCSDT